MLQITISQRVFDIEDSHVYQYININHKEISITSQLYQLGTLYYIASYLPEVSDPKQSCEFGNRLRNGHFSPVFTNFTCVSMC